MVFKTSTYNRRTYDGGSQQADYSWSDAVDTTDTILANIQPSSGEDLELLPEGDLPTEAITIYTDDAIATQPRQEVEYNGAWYRILKVQDWTAFSPAISVAHYMGVAVRVEAEAA